MNEYDLTEHTLDQLLDIYADLYGRRARSHDKAYLRKRIYAARRSGAVPRIGRPGGSVQLSDPELQGRLREAWKGRHRSYQGFLRRAVARYLRALGHDQLAREIDS